MAENVSSTAAKWVGGVTAALLIATALIGYAHAGGGGVGLAFAVLFGAATAAFVFGLAQRRLVAWLIGVLGGVFGGWLSVVELLVGESFVEEFFVATATLAFFVVLGFSFGALAEFVRLLHFLLHGGRIWDYPQRARSVDKIPPKP